MDVGQLMAEQGGVLARYQALIAGMSDAEVDARVADGAWSTVHPGVYAVHGAPFSWHERAWAGVLACWPAALTHESALRAAEGPGRRGRDESVVHVAVARGRNVTTPAGVVVHLLHKFDPRVSWESGPPRMRYEEAVVDCAAEAATDDDVRALLLDTCGGRGPTRVLVREALARRTKHPRRALVNRVLRELDRA
ncbi:MULTISPECIES: hypothetical protein [unclassified Nocardioides]|uniref:hypothetical protein n=1 Tax=unclassified Nocardioides TaxID=2615069 RepID=UPI00301426CD